MKKIILATLISFLPIASAYAVLPLPSVIPDAQPGGGIVSSMQAQQELQRQYMEMQMMREQLAIMQQQRAMMEMQALQQQASEQKYKQRKNHR